LLIIITFITCTDELHAELCFAEALLLKALLTFIEDETLVSFIRAGIKIRSCYNSYKYVFIRYSTTETFKSIVWVCDIGGTYLILSNTYILFTRGGSNCLKFEKSNQALGVSFNFSKVELNFENTEPNQTQTKCSNFKIVQTKNSNSSNDSNQTFSRCLLLNIK